LIYLKEWLAKEDCQNPWYQENRKHETKSGKMVRSKSEVIIADSLFDNELMFKYEPKIVICGKILYPDFGNFISIWIQNFFGYKISTTNDNKNKK
jgi:hypothetical protein